MLTARRMRERQAGEAAGLPPPAPPRRQDIPWHEHEAALANLERTHRDALEQLRAGTAGTFTINVDSEDFQAAIKPLVEEFEAKAKQIVERNDELEKMLEAASAKVTQLESEKLELSAKAEAATKELIEWQAAADVPSAKAELVSGSAVSPEATPAPVVNPAATTGEDPKKASKPKAR
jgi:hypothetical protein